MEMRMERFMEAKTSNVVTANVGHQMRMEEFYKMKLQSVVLYRCWRGMTKLGEKLQKNMEV